MLDCQTMGRLLHPYLDGELSAREALDIQAHLERCPDCGALYRNEKLFLDLLKGSLSVPVAPDNLRQRVRKVMEAAGQEKRSRKRVRLMAVPSLALTVVALLVIGILSLEKKPLQDLVDVAVNTHQGYLNDNLPLDIKSNDPIQVVRWFEKRTNFPISLGQEPVKNLRLLGGRLVEFHGENAVFLAYAMGQYRLSLLMTAAEGVNLFGAEGFNLKQTRFYQSANHGFQTLSWAQEGLAYVIVSEKQELNKQVCMICHGSDREQHIPKGFFDKEI
jgi:anti-sigma factor RsiW